jgi:uncharacterized membrane protein
LLFYIATAVVPAVFVGVGVFRRRQRLSWQTLPYEGAAALLLVVAVNSALYLPMGDDVFYPVVFNILLLLGILGLIFMGYLQRQEVWVNLALVFFSLDVVTRYFELSWSLFDRSVVFILAGIILLGGGFLLERGRRQMFERMRRQEATHGP